MDVQSNHHRNFATIAVKNYYCTGFGFSWYRLLRRNPCLPTGRLSSALQMASFTAKATLQLNETNCLL